MKNKLKRFIEKNKVISAIIILLCIIIFIALISNKTTVDVSQTPSVNVTPVKKIVSEADKERLEVLKKNFNYDYDEFEKKGWYQHKDQIANNSFDRTFLKVIVNSSGYSYLADQYYGDDWIFHTRVEVLVGDKKYQTSDIPFYDPNSSHTNGSGSVWELISYTADRDNGIIKAIVENSDDTVKVRFTGGEGIKDITLSKKDQQAIKDSYELARLIKEASDN
ncbi:MAG: hypothetical protein WC229_00975 [Candidatus Paceibacterota bacterium]|jgi:formate-dependent nitrite reductase cytochrome c552 subunit